MLPNIFKRKTSTSNSTAHKGMKNSTFAILVALLLILIAIFTFMGGKKSASQKISVKNSKEVVNNINQPFDAKATIKMKDLVMVADINRSNVGECTVMISEPKTLSGMQFRYNGDDVSVSYKGFTVKLNEKSKLVKTVADIVVGAIDKASSPSGVDVAMENGTLVLKGDSDAGKFKMILDKTNGSIVSLSVPSVDFDCNFSDFIFKQAKKP